MSQQHKVRRLVLTGAVTAITATGAWYGAGLKTKQEMKKEVQARREATPAEMIAQLEEARGVLVAKRIGLERKIQGLEARRNEREGRTVTCAFRESRATKDLERWSSGLHNGPAKSYKRAPESQCEKASEAGRSVYRTVERKPPSAQTSFGVGDMEVWAGI